MATSPCRSIFDLACQLGMRISPASTVARLVQPLLDLSAAMDAASREDFDAWLFWAAVPPTGAPPCSGPALTGILSLRLGSLHELSREERRVLPPAGFLCAVGTDRIAAERIQNPSANALGTDVLRAIQCARERLDGSGPLGLREADLDPAGQILAVAWAYSEKTKGQGRFGHRALAEIFCDTGGFSAAFSWRLVQALSAFPLGSLVRLSNGELGRVTGSSADDPMKPAVSVRIDGDGRPVDPPRRISLAAQKDVRIVGLLEDPLAPEPLASEPAAAWLRRLREAAITDQPKIPALPAALIDPWPEPDSGCDGGAKPEVVQDRRSPHPTSQEAASPAVGPAGATPVDPGNPTTSLPRKAEEAPRRGVEGRLADFAALRREIQTFLDSMAALRGSASSEEGGPELQRGKILSSFHAACRRLGGTGASRPPRSDAPDDLPAG